MEYFDTATVNSQTIIKADTEKNIIFGVDGNFIYHAIVAIISIINHAGDSTYQFHIMSSELTEQSTGRLKDIFTGHPHGLTLHHLSNELFNSFSTTELFTRATYFRLLAPLLLNKLKQILYLDADIVCLNSLDDLWLAEIEQESIAMVVGEREEFQLQLAKGAGLKREKYFNAGMMLINVPQWNINRVSEKTFKILTERSQYFKYLDQDALNNILEGDVSYIEQRFNTIVMLRHDSEGYTYDVPSNTCLLHYAGADKPWQVWNQQHVCRYYQDIHRQYLMDYCPFDLPQLPEQAKKMYRSLFRSNDILKGIYWRIIYYKIRYFERAEK